MNVLEAMRWSRALATILAVAFCAMMPAKAGDVLADHALNVAPWSWGVWGKAVVTDVKDAAVRGGAFKRVVIAPMPEHPWDVGIFVTLQKPVKKGDVIVFVFWAQAEVLPKDSEFTPLTARVFDTATTSISVISESTMMVGKSWKRYIASGIADKDYAPGALSGGVTLGTGEQTLDIGQVVIAGFAPGFDVAALPSE